MKYYEDKTDKEIAQYMGVSRQAISKIKSNIRAKLKRDFEM
ncbi:sigma factor-like helix-turn-helix DNA-binding protein [Paenibacillus oralis]|nr:sigma factor-like helix-turn-helix DNA-binding protein [Paenibacillus oralis]